MTQQEKLLTLHFLYDLLSHREGDIRRQAGRLMGTIIAGYDDIYRKKLPEGAKGFNKSEAVNIWKMYLDKIVFPDYKVTDQHRSWIGYTLKVVIQGMLEHTDEVDIKLFMDEYFKLFVPDLKDSEIFVLLDSVIAVPEEIIGEREAVTVLNFAASVSGRESVEIKAGALRAAEYITGLKLECGDTPDYVRTIIDNVRSDDSSISIIYLIHRILSNMKNP